MKREVYSAQNIKRPSILQQLYVDRSHIDRIDEMN